MSRWAEKYIGIPFDRSRTKGQDCWGLVRQVFKEQRGLDLPQYDDIDPYNQRAVARAMKGTPLVPHRRVELKDMQPFDVVLMWGYAEVDGEARLTKGALHVGVAVSKNDILHVELVTDSVIVRKTHPTVAARIIAVYRYEGEGV